MSYEGVREAEKKCTDKGLKSERVSSTVTKAVHGVYCVDDKGESKATTRGQFGRTPWTKDVGLSLRYIPSWANDQLEAQLNVQNLLNSSTVTKYNETGDYGRTETRKNLNFLTPTDFQAPRYAEVVLRYKF